MQDNKIAEMKEQILAMEVELTTVVKDQLENNMQIADTKVSKFAYDICNKADANQSTNVTDQT